MSNFDPSIPTAAPANSSVGLDYNGTTFDLRRGNLSQVLMASSSISASTAISVTNFNARGIYAYMNITSAFPGSGSTTLALKIKAIPPNATASTMTIAAVAARSASGQVAICMYPGAIAGSASADALITTSGRPVPRDFQVVASYSSALANPALTLSIGMHVIL